MSADRFALKIMFAQLHDEQPAFGRTPEFVISLDSQS